MQSELPQPRRTSTNNEDKFDTSSLVLPIMRLSTSKIESSMENLQKTIHEYKEIVQQQKKRSLDSPSTNKILKR